MITRMTGQLSRVMDEEVRLLLGPIEYQIMVPEFVRRQIQTKTGEEITFHISEYLEGNQMSSRFIPRLIGFLHEAELAFFDLFCTVDKIGIKKALKALGRPIKEIAGAIQRQDVKWLTTLPGIGKTTAEQIIATLRTKVTAYAMIASPVTGVNGKLETSVGIDPVVLEDSYAALLSLGLSPVDARNRLDLVVRSGTNPTTIDEIISLVFKKG